MNSKVILGLVFALSFSLVIGSNSHAYAQTGPTGPQCNANSHPIGQNGINGCACDTGYTQSGFVNGQPVCTIPAIGGMGIPVDSTALLLAGVQGSALWMIPAIVVAGAGIGIFSFKRSKKFSGKEDKA